MDLSEAAAGTYEYAGTPYELVMEDNSRWLVYAEGIFIGDVHRLDAPDDDSEQRYGVRTAGDEESVQVITNDWRSAIETLIGLARS